MKEGGRQTERDREGVYVHNLLKTAGASTPSEAMMHFPPCLRFPPYFREIFRLCGKCSNFTFSRKISRFSSAKISDDLFLVIDHKFQISPVFPVPVHFPPVSRKLLFLPYFDKFPLCFRKFHQLFAYFMCISFPPYFDHA